jgi:hypothetical protein
LLPVKPDLYLVGFGCGIADSCQSKKNRFPCQFWPPFYAYSAADVSLEHLPTTFKEKSYK